MDSTLWGLNPLPMRRASRPLSRRLAPLVLRGPGGGTARSGIRRARRIRALDHRIVERRLHDRRLQVIEDHATNNAVKSLERPAVIVQLRIHLLVEDELDVAVATERQRHDERPRFASV